MTTVTPTLSSWVDGRWVAGPLEDDDIDPTHPDRVVAQVASADAAVAGAAIEAAAQASSAWSRRPAGERGEVLFATAAIVEARAAQIGHDMATELGKPLAESIGEARRAAQILRYYAGLTLAADGQTFPSASRTTLAYARRSAVGTVAVITPWNFPIAIPAWKIAPALAFGNTVVWKPAELVPLTSTHLAKAFEDAGLPAGTLNMVLGSGRSLGPLLVTDPRVDAVTFTGSNPVGQSVRARAAELGKRVQLELGGKNPAVVLADADLGFAARTVAKAAFLSAGQKCTATSRVIVEESVREQFVELLAAEADSFVIGDPTDPAVTLGPVASLAQWKTVTSYLEEGRAAGHVASNRSVTPDEGYFVPPTVLVDLPADSRLLREEIFGPIVSVQSAGSYDDAVAQANDTEFGLAASLFTGSLQYALRFADDAQVGIVKVNQETSGVEPHLPFGGMKQSAYGPQEQGTAAAEFFTRWRSVYVDRIS